MNNAATKTTLTFQTTQFLTSEEQARIKTVLLRALTEYSPSKLDNDELDAIVKLVIEDR